MALLYQHIPDQMSDIFQGICRQPSTVKWTYLWGTSETRNGLAHYSVFFTRIANDSTLLLFVKFVRSSNLTHLNQQKRKTWYCYHNENICALFSHVLFWAHWSVAERVRIRTKLTIYFNIFLFRLNSGKYIYYMYKVACYRDQIFYRISLFDF